MDRSTPTSVPNSMPGLETTNLSWEHLRWFLFLLLIIPVALALWYIIHRRLKKLRKLRQQQALANQKFYRLSFESDLENQSRALNPFAHDTWFPPFRDQFTLTSLLYSDYYRLAPHPHYKQYEKLPPPIPYKDYYDTLGAVAPSLPSPKRQPSQLLPPAIPEKAPRSLPPAPTL